MLRYNSSLVHLAFDKLCQSSSCKENAYPCLLGASSMTRGTRCFTTVAKSAFG